MSALEVHEHCRYPGHALVVDVDDHGYAFDSCRRDDSTFCGDALVYGQVNETMAEMIRRSAREYLGRLARTVTDASGARSRNVDLSGLADGLPTGALRVGSTFIGPPPRPGE